MPEDCKRHHFHHDNGVDAAMDRAACFGTLTMLESEENIFFHGTSNGLDNRLRVQSQPIVNSADIVIHIVMMCWNTSCSDIGCTNVVSVGRIQFGRQMMVHASRDGGDVVDHGRE